MIRIGNSATDRNNEISQNVTVNDFKARDGFELVPFECSVSGKNTGCEKRVDCPTGKHAVAARAACNLEHGIVSDSLLDVTPWDYLKVFRSSGTAGSARCFVGQAQTATGEIKIETPHQAPGVRVGCKEDDKNGGDCQVRGELLCL